MCIYVYINIDKVNRLSSKELLSNFHFAPNTLLIFEAYNFIEPNTNETYICKRFESCSTV